MKQVKLYETTNLDYIDQKINEFISSRPGRVLVDVKISRWENSRFPAPVYTAIVFYDDAGCGEA